MAVCWRYLDLVENSDCFLCFIELCFWRGFPSISWLWLQDGPGTPGASCFTGCCKRYTVRTKVVGCSDFLQKTHGVGQRALVWGTCFIQTNNLYVMINKHPSAQLLGGGVQFLDTVPLRFCRTWMTLWSDLLSSTSLCSTEHWRPTASYPHCHVFCHKGLYRQTDQNEPFLSYLAVARHFVITTRKVPGISLQQGKQSVSKPNIPLFSIPLYLCI